MTRQLVVCIGGPAYTGVTRVEHTAYVAQLAAELFHSGMDVRLNYKANTLVGNARAELLTDCMDRGHDVLISIDTDVWCPNGVHAATPIMRAALSMVAMASLMTGDDIDRDTGLQYWPLAELQAAQASLRMDSVAALGLACATRERTMAVWKTDRARMSLDDYQRPIRKCWAFGMGYVIFNVAWYRRHRSLARRFDSIVDGMSEDVSHCRAVAVAGGDLYTALATTYHKPWGSDELLLVTPPGLEDGPTFEPHSAA